MAHVVAKAESGLQYINRNDRHWKAIPPFTTDTASASTSRPSRRLLHMRERLDQMLNQLPEPYELLELSGNCR